MNDINPLGLQPPRRTTIVESIIEQIVSLIKSGKLQPGDKLPSERQLMETLNVSRISVRGALQGLVAMGLLEQRLGAGTFVRSPTPRIGFDMDIETLSSALQKEMRIHLNQARLLLELEIVALAAKEATDANRRAILSALAKYEEHKLLASEEKGWPKHDELHLKMAEATGNPILVEMLRNLLGLVPDSLRHQGIRQGTPEAIADRIETERSIHRELCNALVEGDVQTAQEWMRQHGENEVKVINDYYGE